MPRTSERGGPQTRARIAEVASGLFLDQGFDAVTVAQVAKAAGVSSVTVFKHFPRKEDLFLDRAADAETLLRSAVRERGHDLDALESLHRHTRRLIEDRHPLSGLDEKSVPFFRTVAGSAALVGRSREIAATLQHVLADELAADPSFDGDGGQLAALLVAGYADVLVQTARRLIAGEARTDVETDHRERHERLFATLRSGIGG